MRRAVMYGNPSFETSSAVTLDRMSRARGPQSPKQPSDPVTSRIVTPSNPPSPCCLRIHPMSWLPNAVPVTSMKRSSASRVTVRSHSMPPRVFSIWVYVTVPVARSTSFADSRWRNAAASGPLTSILAKLDSSNRPARSRVAMCSAAMALDQCSPAHPRGRSRASDGSSFDVNQFARSQPDFSPNSAPRSASRAYVGAVLSGRPACRSSPG